MDRIAYLMRGLPSCGKSYTAKRLASDTGDCDGSVDLWRAIYESNNAELAEKLVEGLSGQRRHAARAGNTPLIT